MLKGKQRCTRYKFLCNIKLRRMRHAVVAGFFPTVQLENHANL